MGPPEAGRGGRGAGRTRSARGARQEGDDDSYRNPLYSTDAFRLNCYKVLPCAKRYGHSWHDCPFAHPGEKARRRSLAAFAYSAAMCPDVRGGGACPRGDACGFAHNCFEHWLHPALYRTRLCRDGAACRRRVCFFAHCAGELRAPGGGAPATPAAAAVAAPPLGPDALLASAPAHSSPDVGGWCAAATLQLQATGGCSSAAGPAGAPLRTGLTDTSCPLPLLAASQGSTAPLPQLPSDWVSSAAAASLSPLPLCGSEASSCLSLSSPSAAGGSPVGTPAALWAVQRNAPLLGAAGATSTGTWSTDASTLAAVLGAARAQPAQEGVLQVLLAHARERAAAATTSAAAASAALDRAASLYMQLALSGAGGSDAATLATPHPLTALPPRPGAPAAAGLPLGAAAASGAPALRSLLPQTGGAPQAWPPALPPGHSGAWVLLPQGPQGGGAPAPPVGLDPGY